MYKTENPIVLENLNEYFVREKSDGTGMYFCLFLCRYEKFLEIKARDFLERYSLNEHHIDDLKQIFAEVLWNKLASYNPESEIPFLATVNYDVLRAWHKFVRKNCGVTTIHNEKFYADLRKAARIYYKANELSVNERISAVQKQLGIPEEKAIEYIRYAEQFRFSEISDADEDDTAEDENLQYAPVETRLHEPPLTVEEEYFRQRRREIINEVYESPDYNEQRIFVETIGVCPYCFGYIPRSEKKTCEQLALILGYSDGDVVRRIRKGILKKFEKALRKEE